MSASVIDYDYNSCDFDLLNALIYEVDWRHVLGGNIIAICFEEFIKRVNVLVNENVARVKPKVYKLPWYTKGLKKLKNLRSKFYNRFKVSNCPTDGNWYIHYMREYNFLNKFLYNQYIMSYNESLKNNPKRLI